MSAHLLCMDIVTSGVAPPDFKTQAESADIIKLPKRTLEDWRLNHVGPPYMKLDRHVRYDLAEVFAWARARRPAPRRM